MSQSKLSFAKAVLDRGERLEVEFYGTPRKGANLPIGMLRMRNGTLSIIVSSDGAGPDDLSDEGLGGRFVDYERNTREDFFLPWDAVISMRSPPGWGAWTHFEDET